MALLIDADVRTGRRRVLARMATTGIYLLRDLPRELQRAARARALSEGTTLGSVLRHGLREYAAGTWTPTSDDKAMSGTAPASSVASEDRHVTSRGRAAEGPRESHSP